MSQIFDALQRSEAERNGKDAAPATRATDLLQLTERQAVVSRPAAEHPVSWNSTATTEAPVAVAEANSEPEVTVAHEMLSLRAAPLPREEADDPTQCETLSIAASAEGHLVALPENESAAGEAFNLLGVRLRHLRRQRPLKRILITSTIPQEGKSMVASNVACTLALRTQQKVLLLEGDVRRPTQSRIFGIAHKPGICEWLNGERSLIQSMYRLEGPGIWIFPAGASTANSLKLLQSGRVAPMMEQLSSWFDWVVIDSPPILPLADTSVWTAVADGILLVTRQGTTEKRQLQRGLEALGTQKLIGAVLNSARSAVHTDYYYRSTNRLPNEDAQE